VAVSAARRKNIGDDRWRRAGLAMLAIGMSACSSGG
jgi:hypothetical protein